MKTTRNGINVPHAKTDVLRNAVQTRYIVHMPSGTGKRKRGRPAGATRKAISLRVKPETAEAVFRMASKNGWSLTETYERSVAFAAARKDFA